MMKKMSSVILLSIVCCAALFSQGTHAAPTQQFSFGIVQGVDTQSTISKRPVYAYYGIPYAEPPVGALRFKPPVPYVGRNPSAVISSRTYREACVQDPPAEEAEMSEDCLHLNVFVPAEPSLTQRKVMVWIHGGGYVVGDAVSYPPTELVADYDVIVVTVQYRLGYLGFLSTGDAAQPGNNGLRDQILALQWIKDNIRAFGGDGDDVTIFGESAGGGSVSFLSLSPYANGLFTKAIMQSGTAFSPWSIMEKDMALTNVYNLAGRLNCLSWWYLPGRSVSYHEDIIQCLRDKPAMEIMRSQVPEGEDDIDYLDLTKTIVAAPTVDGDFVPNTPKSLLKNKAYLQRNGVLDRSYIVGTTNDEGLLFLPAGQEFYTKNESVRSLARYSSRQLFPLSTNREMQDLIEFVYSYPRDSEGRVPFQGIVNLMSDTLFVYPSYEFVTLMADVSPTTDVFHYLFDHYFQFGDDKGPTSKLSGTSHGFDLIFLFDQEDNTGISSKSFIDPSDPDSRSLTDAYRGTFAQFAKTGNPSRAGSGGFPASWPRFDLKDKYYMAIAPKSEVRRELYPQRMSLWKDYLPQLATNIFTGRRIGKL